MKVRRGLFLEKGCNADRNETVYSVVDIIHVLGSS